MSEQLRLNKFLAKWAFVSRRKAEEQIQTGQVFVNGKKIFNPGYPVDPKQDKIRVLKKYIQATEIKLVYLMFHKPTKVLSTSSDPTSRETVMDFIPKSKERLFLVGRLDWDSEGLLLLTNDGDFSEQILKPQNNVLKTYLVNVRGFPKDTHLRKLKRGVNTPVGPRKAVYVEWTRKGDIKVILKEGKNRQIRLMFDALGFPVTKLKRVAIGRLKLNKLPKRHFVTLNEKDIQKIFLLPKELQNILLP